jgi:signal peptide peptidase SppA
MQLVHLASRLYGTPLLIARSKLDVILSILGPRIGLPEIDAAVPVPTSKPGTSFGQPRIAIIHVHGTLVRRAMGLEAASGLTSYGEIAARLDAALADPQVSGILLDVDSPGGEAGGVFELAERIRAANDIKPVWAHANDSAYSAAYAIAAAASRLTLSQTAGVGSIGVIALHVDQSVKDAKDGVDFTAIYAGHHKNDFSPHAPLSPQAASTLQAEVDRLYGIFVSQVAQMRGLDSDAVRATEAGLIFGDAAVATGLADAVMSFDQVLVEFTNALDAQRRLATPSANTAKRRPQARASPVALNASHQIFSHQHSHLEQTMTDQEQQSPMDDPDPELTPEPPETPAQEPAAPPVAVSITGATTNGRIEAQAIAEICLIAGTPQRTAEFLASGMNEAQVRRALLEARAEQPEIASRITADAGTTVRPESSPVVAAVKKLATKE